MSQNSKTFITKNHMIYTLLVIVSIACGATLFLPWPMSLIPFGAILGLLFLIANFKYPMVGVYAYMFIFFFKPQDWSSVNLPYEKVIALVVIATLLFNITFKEKKFELYSIDKSFAAFLAVCFISIMTAGYVELAWDTFFKFFKVFLVYVFASRIANTPKRLNSIVWLYIFSLVFIMITTIVNFYTGGSHMNMGIERAGGIGDNGMDPNSLASTLLLGIPFYFFLIKHYKINPYMKFFFVSLMLLTGWTIMITGSRGGMLGIIVVSFLIALSSKYKVLTSVAAVMILAVLVAFMPGQYKERFTSIFSVYGGEETAAAVSAQGRVDGLVKGFVFMTQRPLFGYGIGNFKWANSNQYGMWLDAHNLPGKLLGELGLAGLICFFFFIYTLITSIQLIKYIYQRYKWEKDFNWYLIEAISYVLILMMYQGMLSHNLFRENWYVLACFIIIVSTITNQRYKKEKESKNDDSQEESALIGVTK